MTQADIWLVDFNPVIGSEQAGIRPAVIISGNTMNLHFSLVMVCPITTKIKNYYGNLIVHPNEENGLKEISEILSFHIRTISKKRLIKRLGQISSNQMKELLSYTMERMHL